MGSTAEAEECARGTCRHRATRLCVEATRTLAEASGGSVVFEGRPWNSNTVDLIRLARAHCLLVLHSTFADSVAKMAAEVRACITSASDMGLASTQSESGLKVTFRFLAWVLDLQLQQG